MSGKRGKNDRYVHAPCLSSHLQSWVLRCWTWLVVGNDLDMLDVVTLGDVVCDGGS